MSKIDVIVMDEPTRGCHCSLAKTLGMPAGLCALFELVHTRDCADCIGSGQTTIWDGDRPKLNREMFKKFHKEFKDARYK